MNLKDLKKKLFIASRFCNFYHDKDKTVLRGIPFSKGYLFNIKLSDEKIKLFQKFYAKCNAGASYTVLIMVVLFLYLGVFPNYLKIIKLQPVVMDLVLVVLPVTLVVGILYGIGLFLEKYIENFIGSCKVIQFKPTIYNIDRDEYEKYISNSNHKQNIINVLVMATILCVFFVPLLLLNVQMKNKQYSPAVKSANVFLAVNPLPAKVYAMRAYAKFQTKDYQGAIDDYQKANEYSLTNIYDPDRYIVMTKLYDAKTMIKRYNEAISQEPDKAMKYSYIFMKANFEYRIKDYGNALKDYNIVMKAYKNNEKLLLQTSQIYFRRGKTYEKLGNSVAYHSDMVAAKSLCPECEYDKHTEKQITMLDLSY